MGTGEGAMRTQYVRARTQELIKTMNKWRKTDLYVKANNRNSDGSNNDITSANFIKELVREYHETENETLLTALSRVVEQALSLFEKERFKNFPLEKLNAFKQEIKNGLSRKDAK